MFNIAIAAINFFFRDIFKNWQVGGQGIDNLK
jgi:hypothetical protein